MSPTSPKKSKRSLTSRMIKAFGDFRKKKPSTKQPQKPTKAIKSVQKPMPKKTTVVPVTKPMAPKKIVPPAAPVLPRSPRTPAHNVEFHQDGLFIDGIKYKVLAESGISDEELTIGKSQEENGTTTMQLHAMGRTFTVTLHPKDTDTMLASLLSGRPSKIESEEGMMIRFERQMY